MKRKAILCYILTAVLCMSFLQVLPEGAKKVSATTEDLILNLKFDGDLTDSSGHSYHGACTYGKITYEKGILGQCAVFDGKSYVEVQDTDALDLKDSFTISLWAYKEYTGEEYVPYLYKQEDEESWAPPYMLYENFQNDPCVYLHDGESGTELDQFSVDGDVVDIRQWFLMTVTYDGSEVRIYYDKQLVKKVNVTGVPAATVGNLYIGLKDGSVYYKGKMDDLRIYSRAISADEVGYNYDDGLASNPAFLKQTDSLVAHYRFEDNYKDSSKFGNNAEKVTGEGTVKFVDGMNGKAVQFTKGSYLEIEDNDSINFDEGFSLTAWICAGKSDIDMALINRLGVSTGFTSNDAAYQLFVDDDGGTLFYVPFGFQTNAESSDFDLTSSMRNRWFHIGVTFSGDEIRWYKNGTLIKKEAIDGIKIAHAGGNLMIGSDGENFFEGSMDELKLFNYPLSADEVKAEAERIDSIYISKTNAAKIKAFKPKETLVIKVSRKYIESGVTKTISSGVTYQSSNKKIFTVSSTGKITAISKGTAKLTITHGGISKVYTVTIK